MIIYIWYIYVIEGPRFFSLYIYICVLYKKTLYGTSPLETVYCLWLPSLFLFVSSFQSSKRGAVQIEESASKNTWWEKNSTAVVYIYATIYHSAQVTPSETRGCLRLLVSFLALSLSITRGLLFGRARTKRQVQECTSNRRKCVLVEGKWSVGGAVSCAEMLSRTCRPCFPCIQACSSHSC